MAFISQQKKYDCFKLEFDHSKSPGVLKLIQDCPDIIRYMYRITGCTTTVYIKLAYPYTFSKLRKYLRFSYTQNVFIYSLIGTASFPKDVPGTFVKVNKINTILRFL